MKKAYLLAFSSTLGTQDEVKACLNTFSGIIWKYDMPNSFYIISEESANEISKRIRNHFGSGRYIVTEIPDSNKQGWLPAETWDLINNKKLK